jgi:hypothetical protein
MAKLIQLTLKPATPEKSFTQIALDTLDEARRMILDNDAKGQPVTQVVVAMGVEYVEGGQDRLRTQWVTGGNVADLEALGLITLVGKDMFG